MRRTTLRISLLMLFVTVVAAVHGQAQVQPLTRLEIWKRAEFRIVNVPATANPFDPAQISVDARIALPNGAAVTIPAFWYQPFTRALVDGREILTRNGAPEWRLRYTPPEAGIYSVAVQIHTNNSPYPGFGSSTFSVPKTASTNQVQGYSRVAANRQWLESERGEPLRLVGHNVCWHHAKGTFDYDEWFAAMAKSGENFARLWMWPYAFGLETDNDSLNRYKLDRAWQLDYVLQLAEERGIHILLCLDYHGMFEQKPDYWGGNNYWQSNPYNATNGGPSFNQNGFFTNNTANALYEKRLRYLVARYGYSPNLLAWEFFNEIDNVYAYLVPADVASWHQRMARWFRANDPYKHMVTTSLTGNSDRAEIWSIPELDFSAYHSYAESGPATRLSTVAQSFLKRYSKPVMVGEFGTDWRGWNRQNDPYLRGWRQGLWGGALGGSLGSTMSWWWEDIHSANLYPFYQGLTNVLFRTGWGRGAWSNVAFVTSGSPPATVDDVIPNDVPFSATLVPGSGWGTKVSGRLAVANSYSAGFAAANLNSHLHGTAHAELRTPFRISAWVSEGARLVLHVNSVSSGAALLVRVNGVQMFRTNLANLDNAWTVSNEYNIDIPVALSPGKKDIEVINAGADWIYLDWVRLEKALPANYPGNWKPSPESIGLSTGAETLIYVVAPGVTFPAGATNSNLPNQTGSAITITNFSPGDYIVEWYMPTNGIKLTTSRAGVTNGALKLELPLFYEDIVGRIIAPPKLRAMGLPEHGTVTLEVRALQTEPLTIEVSPDLRTWEIFTRAESPPGTMTLTAPISQTNKALFFRARSG